MTFESIFSGIHNTAEIELQPDKDKSISKITEKPFYVVPSFFDLKTHSDAKIMVISAPGATGKSALAQYLAYKYSSIYWNLADITLGDNSFIGTLVRSIGLEKYSNYMKCLLNGETILVIDAFDEAEMISGANAVRSFLSEIAKTVEKAKLPCIILLSRAETAQSICAYYDENGTLYSHYEISFFEKSQSEDFIRQIVNKKQKSKQNDDIINNCINQYLGNISKIVSSEELTSFIGYAPVLEVIGEHIAQENNAYKYWETLKNDGMKGVDVIAKILNKLLDREQEKVKNSLIKKLENHFDITYINENDIYSPTEQLINIITLVVFGEYDAAMAYRNSIPDEIRDEYNDIISSFLPQHPFIRSSRSSNGYDFTGPAFRDYVLSKIIDDSFLYNTN